MSCKSCDSPAKFVSAADGACPSRMADGRAFTDYRPRCAVQSELMQSVTSSVPNPVFSSYEARIFLQKNAEKLMAKNQASAMKNLAPCAPCGRPANSSGTMLPERYVVRCDGVSCTRTEVNPSGLGDGRQYF